MAKSFSMEDEDWTAKPYKDPQKDVKPPFTTIFVMQKFVIQMTYIEPIYQEILCLCTSHFKVEWDVWLIASWLYLYLSEIM